MKCLRVTFLMTVANLVLSAVCSATVYYVDSASGKDTNNGASTSAPWKTLGKVSSAKYVAGDQILLKRGSTWREQINVSSSGAAGNPILIGAYDSGNPPLINGADLVGNWSSNSGYVYRASIAWVPSHVWYNGTLLKQASSITGMTSQTWFYSTGMLYVWAPGNVSPNGHAVEAERRSRAIDLALKSYITIDGLSMKNSSSSLVAAWGAGHITVRNSALKNSWVGVYVTSASPYLVVDHCTFITDPGYVGRDFVLVSSTTADSPIVSNNVVGDTRGFVAIMFADVNNAQAYNNTVTGSGGGIETAALTRSVSGALFHDNSIFKNDHALQDGEAIKIRGTPPYTASAKVYRNYIQGGAATWDGIGGWYASSSEIYGNIVMNCVNYGIQFTLGSYNNTFYNNTLYKNAIAGLAFYTQGSADVKNNIIQYSSVGISADSSISMSEDYNLINQVSQLRSIYISAGSHTITANPSFVSGAPKTSSDFKLNPGSPAIGSGTSLGTPYNMTLDPSGTVFPYPALDQNALGGWERGAFAYR
jgi:hypothetical protein